MAEPLLAGQTVDGYNVQKDSVYDQVKRVFDQKNIPVWVWYPIMRMESGGNPTSHNSPAKNGGKEDSRGLFQINIKANPRFANDNLFDPVVNATIARDYFIEHAWNKAKSMGMSATETTAYVWKNGIRPYWTDAKNRSIQSLTSKVLGGDVDVNLPSGGGQTPLFKGTPSFDMSFSQGVVRTILIFIVGLIGIVFLLQAFPATSGVAGAVASTVNPLKKIKGGK